MSQTIGQKRAFQRELKSFKTLSAALIKLRSHSRRGREKKKRRVKKERKKKKNGVYKKIIKQEQSQEEEILMMKEKKIPINKKASPML